MDRQKLDILLTVVHGGTETGITELDAEFVGIDKVVPAGHLLVRLVVPRWQTGRVHEAAQRVSSEVGTVWVEFTSTVGGIEHDGSLVEEPDDLDVCFRPHELEKE